MKEQEKIDRRVKRTKKVLTEALIRILKNKNIENVTVSELAKEADITRTTFYQYYRDPIEMLENLQKDIARDLEKIVEKTEGETPKNFSPICLLIFIRTGQRRIFCFSASEIKQDLRKSDIMYITNISLRWKDKFLDKNLKRYEYYRYYIVFGCIAVVENWAQNGMQETPEEMTEIALSLLPAGKIYLK